MCIWLILFSFFKLFSQITRLAWANNSFYWLWRTWVGDLAHIAFCRSSLWTHKSQDEPRLDYASKCKIWPKLFLLAYFFLPPSTKREIAEVFLGRTKKIRILSHLDVYSNCKRLTTIAANDAQKWRWTHSGQNSSWTPKVLGNTYFPICKNDKLPHRSII